MKNIVLIFIFIFTAQLLKASECYHYHTGKKYELETVGGKLFLALITTDPNKISIAGYSKILLKDILPANSKIVAETQDGVIVKNDVAYYYIPKSTFYDDKLLIDKIAESSLTNYPQIGFTFFMDGFWKKLAYNPYYPTKAQRVKFTPVKNMPKNATIMASFPNGGTTTYLLKDKSKVYSYDESSAEVTIIKNITPSTAKIDTLNESSDEFCIYDDNTFYLTRDNFRTVENVTTQFKDRPLKQSFLKLKFHRPNSFRTYLDFQDGALWSYVSAGISLEQGGDVNFYQVENSKYLEPSGLVLHKGFLYDDPWNLVYENHPIDLPKLKNIKDFALNEDGSYSVGKDIYKVRDLDGGSILEKVENIVAVGSDAVRTFNNALWTYRHPISMFFATKNSITFYNAETQKIEKEINFKSPLKNLILAYAFDNKLLIENEVIQSMADYESMEFLGSTVQVVSPCDGGRGQIEIVVNYDYYFKDKNGVYKYHTGNKGLVKLKDINALDCTQANFIETFWDKKKEN
ncbi:hypothetical protein EZJ43_13405 [Pedobacter changchengzhani]|uniref:Uncharacterized protein n=1 Tax=Pedobacter changchengzhani TaxID=2529274 RepID=A0A4R5MJ67_9SPHI|nr:hypothetical protein [Pedobacter changchengzhani]TDG35611.1 hypothetical protein EZJ43_13405 [Pedobacter changchengzhani]